MACYNLGNEDFLGRYQPPPATGKGSTALNASRDANLLIARGKKDEFQAAVDTYMGKSGTTAQKNAQKDRDDAARLGVTTYMASCVLGISQADVKQEVANRIAQIKNEAQTAATNSITNLQTDEKKNYIDKIANQQISDFQKAGGTVPPPKDDKNIYLYIGIGIVAFLAITLVVSKKKKANV